MRSLTVTGFDVSESSVKNQLSLFEDEDKTKQRHEKLESAVNNVRHNFGKSSVVYASIIDNDLGIIF